jgi:hypothetical protein
VYRATNSEMKVRFFPVVPEFMPRCNHLTKEGLCDIYDTRPECCRNFPNRLHPNCVDAYRCDTDCENCKDKCCENVTLTHDDFVKSLNINCNDCKQKWK